MAHKLVIGNTVHVPVKFAVNDGGVLKEFSFELICNRLLQDEVRKRTESNDEKVDDFLRSITTGWIGQALVVEEDGSFSPFSPSTFDVMLSLPGVSAVFFRSYIKEVGVREKNSPAPRG